MRTLVFQVIDNGLDAYKPEGGTELGKQSLAWGTVSLFFRLCGSQQSVSGEAQTQASESTSC